MLRYSTMSSLDWEDEQQHVLLTDPNETVAMNNNSKVKGLDSPMKRITKRESIGLLSPLSRSTNVPPPCSTIDFEAHLARLSSELERATQREVELKLEIENVRRLDKDREECLVQEIHRLEADLNTSNLANISIQNSLDSISFEHQSHKDNLDKLQNDYSKLLIINSSSSDSSSSSTNTRSALIDQVNRSYNDVHSHIQDDINQIHQDLEVLQFCKTTKSFMRPDGAEVGL
ncbi:hypothetical protein KEM48_003183 [Puccinia striiformis f. sp. tritici PST-130]|nr:hypothetical protein KEM48_003183 [Puccinia striiformis f. sp. tritici PST-130]